MCLQAPPCEPTDEALHFPIYFGGKADMLYQQKTRSTKVQRFAPHQRE
jgi:hypothetical protein